MQRTKACCGNEALDFQVKVNWMALARSKVASWRQTHRLGAGRNDLELQGDWKSETQTQVVLSLKSRI